MNPWWREWPARIRAVLRKPELDREFEEELASHIELATEENIRQGLSPEQARRKARLQFGALDAAREQHREARGLPFLEVLARDVRYSFRALRRDRGFAGVALLILALGIGANTAVFSVVNAILLRPLPFHEPNRLAWIVNRYPGSEKSGLSGRATRVDVFEVWRARNRSFEDLTAYNPFFGYASHKLTGKGDPERLVGVMVAQNFFPLLGVQPHIGRNFLEEECQQNGPRAVLLSYSLWQRRFAGSPAVLGQSITFDDQPATVVGVMPPDFDLGSVFSPGFQIDLYIPLVYDVVRNWGNTLAVIGRLKPGATAQSANADLLHVNEQIRVEQPERGNWFGSTVASLNDHVSGRLQRALLVLWGAVGVVLLIVCANLSNLLLARAAARRKEIAVRLALGAGRGRIVRQLLTESLMLSSCGAIFGLLLALAATRSLVHVQGLSLPLLERVEIDGTVLVFTVGVTVLAGLLFGIAPGLQITGTNLAEALKESSRGSGASRSHSWVRSALVVSEIALACVLLVGAGLLLRSFLRVLDVDMGFRPAHAVALAIHPSAQLSGSEQRVAFYLDLQEKMQAVPGLDAVGLTDTLPLDRNRSWGVRVKGVVYPDGRNPSAYIRRVWGDYLKAMGIPVIAGRGFLPQDIRAKDYLILVNESGARQLWPGRDPVGQQLIVLGEDMRVVGVVADVRHSSLEEGSGIEIYLPVTLSTPSSLEMVIRSPLPPAAYAAAVREVLWQMDPTIPASDFRPLEYLVDRAVSPRRFFMSLLAGFAGLALVLASLGIYGVIAYSVTRRTREMGIRMALGASAGHVRFQVLRETLRLSLLGMAIGAAGSLALTRLLASLLFGVAQTDPLTYLTMFTLLGAVALVAGYLPARRASSINPMAALRAE